MTRAEEITARGDDSLHAELDELAALQLALEREAQRYRTLFESAPTPYLTTDTTGKITEANRAAAACFQTEARFLEGKPIANYVVGRERRRFRSWLIELHRRHGGATLSVRLQRRSGVPFDARVRAASSEGEIWWTIEDVTAERQAEETVWTLHRELDARVARESGRLQAVFEALPVGIAIVDASLREVRQRNRCARQILGRWDGALPGLGGDATGGDLWQLEAALAGNQTPRRVVAVPAEQGDVLLELSSTPVRDEGGAVVAVALIFSELTASDRREVADAQFVENAAHQLRTPITAIAIAAAALQAGAKDERDELERFVAHIVRESERMARVIDALLGLARIQRGGAGLVIGVVPVHRLVEETLAEVRVPAGIDVDVDVPADVAFVGDAGMAREALANVVRNATVHASSSIRIVATRDDAHALVDVSDDGPGVAPDVRDRIFERFVRGPSTGRGGAGLGLAIAAQAVRVNGGELELLDTPSGTTFRFTLQAARLL